MCPGVCIRNGDRKSAAARNDMGFEEVPTREIDSTRRYIGRGNLRGGTVEGKTCRAGVIEIKLYADTFLDSLISEGTSIATCR